MLNLAPVRHEENYMILCFDHRIVMSYQHLITANDRNNCRSLWQFNVLNFAADNVGAFLVAMRDSFYRLSRAAAQRMHFDYITAADMCEQRTYRYLLR